MTTLVTSQKGRTDREEISRRFDQALQRAGYDTAKQFCARNGVPESSISRLKSGKRGVSVESLVKIARGLGVSTDWLLTGREAKDPPPIYTFSEGSLPALRDALDAAIRNSEASKGPED